MQGVAVTIKDIARLSGVSITTVSRVLNNRPDVSAESRRKVEAVIESTNYIQQLRPRAGAYRFQQHRPCGSRRK